MSITLLKIPFEGEYIAQGDTISKTSFEVVEDGLDLTEATIKMQIYNGSQIVIDVENGSGITVIDSTHFEIDQVEAEDNNLPVGCFRGDLEITDSNDVTFTYTRVEYSVIKAYTR